MKSIDTLVEDVYALVKEKDGRFGTEEARLVSEEATSRLVAQLNPDTSKRGLRLSRMGVACPRALWYSVNHPEVAEQLPPWATIKYSVGHILEAYAIGLAKTAGHKVTGEQDELVVDGIKGHRDCVIDGCVVDIKSCSSRAFIKFKDRTLEQNDGFGYLEQLDGYICGSADDPLVTVKDKGYLWAIDKTLGKMTLYEHDYREAHIRKRIRDYKDIVALDEPPRCTCQTVPYGAAGNIALGTVASYSQFKFSCFPNLRTFLYASGPVYLTHVVRKPDVIEVDRSGNIV